MRSILPSISFLLKTMLFYLLVFQVIRVGFILMNTNLANDAGWLNLIKACIYGIRLDLSMTGYIMVIPFIFFMLSQWLSENKWLDRILVFYHSLILTLIILIGIVDSVLYHFWQQKLNLYASSFAKYPKELLAFSGSIPFVSLSVCTLFIVLSIRFLFTRTLQKVYPVAVHIKWHNQLWATPFKLGLLFLCIRGSWGMAPINQSAAYFSSNMFANHTALNTTWNLLSGLVDGGSPENTNPYSFISDEEAKQLISELFETTGKPIDILQTENPNILFIILEGWSADVVEATDGEKGITPYMQSWLKHSLLFTNFYANGNRTDKGLGAILSGQPALPKSSIINRIHKFNNLPSLASSLKTKNYYTHFFYGGEADFANMKAYLINSGYDHITQIHDFEKMIAPESWGVHDNELFQKLSKDIPAYPQPFFTTVLTLSSHEPYQVPHESAFKGTDESDRYRNAVHFSDEALGKFLQDAKQQEWFNNTLIIILSDHGHHLPKNHAAFRPEKFRIPFLITGGALKNEWHGKTIRNIAQQTDIAPTLLQLCKINNPFNWGRNFLDTVNTGFVTYTYDDGIGFVTSKGTLVYDHIMKKTIFSKDSVDEKMVLQARAYEQLFYQEYILR